MLPKLRKDEKIGADVQEQLQGIEGQKIKRFTPNLYIFLIEQESQPPAKNDEEDVGYKA